jgi:maltooligosyltrehalose trehalohydrolase
LTALTLLGPATPLIFQGEEFAASSPFYFFADHGDGLREAIREGRRTFLEQFPSARGPGVRDALPVPDDPDAFKASKIDWREHEEHAEALALHRDLLQIRRHDPVISAAARRRIDGAVLSAHAFVLRYDGGGADDRLLIVNLGPDLDLTPIPEPLLAPPEARSWALQWSSDALQYGGLGTASLQAAPVWKLHAESAMLLCPDRGD